MRLNYISNNKKDIIYFLIIITVMTIMYILYGNNLYNAHSDIGREFYIPAQMLKGQVLYKDIYNIFGPLGYFLNTLFIKFFGNNVRTFTLIGYGLSLLTLISVYKITKIFCKSETALFLCLFTVFSCIYYPSLSNWITPYSYSIMYSLCSIMWAVYFIFKFIEKPENKYIILSSLLYGFSIASKYEYICFILILLFILIINKSNIKTYFLSFLSILIFPLISLLVLFIQHCSLNDLSMAVNYIIKNSSKEAIGFFFTYCGFFPSKVTYLRLLHPTFDTFFSPLCILTSIITIISLIMKFDKKIIMLNITALILTFKCFFVVSLYVYGTYSLPILLICIAVFLSQLIKTKPYILNIIFIIFILLYALYDIRTIKELNFTSINTQKGAIKIEGDLYPSLIQDINFVKNETKKDDIILYIPEEIILNYITDRDSDNYLFYLVNTNCVVFGDKMITDRLNKLNSDYIIIDNRKYIHFNVTDFKDSYGKDIYKNIKEHYSLYKIIETNYKKEIYKRNK